MPSDAVISAWIGIGGVVIAVIATQFFNLINRRNDFDQKLFFEARNKRLAAYEEIINKFNAMKNPAVLPRSISAREVKNKIYGTYIHVLKLLLGRLYLYGSPASRDIIQSFITDITHLPFDEDCDETLPQTGAHYYAVLRRFIENSLMEFSEFVSIEAGNGFIDIMPSIHSSKHCRRVKKSTVNPKNGKVKKNKYRNSRGPT
jgi:hypothetical protein